MKVTTLKYRSRKKLIKLLQRVYSLTGTTYASLTEVHPASENSNGQKGDLFTVRHLYQDEGKTLQVYQCDRCGKLYVWDDSACMCCVDFVDFRSA